MLKLFKEYKYLVFCSLYGIILIDVVEKCRLFGPPSIGYKSSDRRTVVLGAFDDNNKFVS